MNYADELRRAGIGGTPRLCQDALAELVEELFDGKKYTSPAGRRSVNVYKQELPIPTETDADADTEDAPPPFIIVRTEEGKIRDDDSPQSMEFSMILCAYEASKERTGWQDVANMRETIIQRLCARPYFGGAFTVQKPITWAMQQDDTHPYYYGVITLTCTAPALTQDTELKELL